MIRFVDLRQADPLYGFAWLDTVTSTFLSFKGEQTFRDWGDFEEVASEEEWADLDRFRRLFPGGFRPLTQEEIDAWWDS